MKFKNYLFDLYPYFPKGFSLYNRKDPDVCSKALYDDLCKMIYVRCFLMMIQKKNLK